MSSPAGSTNLITFGAQVCSNLELHLYKEWLEANGLGGYASSTICGANTRRYHGLLVAAITPPTKRMVMLSKLEETFLSNGREYQLSCNLYPGAVHPKGYKYLISFQLRPFPLFRYRVDDVVIEKTVFMARGQNTTIISYHLAAASNPIQLLVRPLIACRDYHAHVKENNAINPKPQISAQELKFTPYYDAPSLYFRLNGAKFEFSPCWYRNFEHPHEARRGLDFREDLHTPGQFLMQLSPGESWNLVVSTEPIGMFHVKQLREQEISRRQSLLSGQESQRDWLKELLLTADSFLAQRSAHEPNTILAGYHWFADWGRDTMISLPGLTLPTGRYQTARQILSHYTKFCEKGMIPNYFPDSGVPEYNSADASLWFIYAVSKFLQYTRDFTFVESVLYDKMVEIIESYSRGTRYGIRVESDGLLSAGQKGLQLTWMDAKVGDWVVTPRAGKAVELNALWHNSLMTMRDLARKFGHSSRAQRYTHMAATAIASFNRLFWNDEAGCLYDCLSNDGVDASIRPNQIFAISLPHPIVGKERARSILKVVEQHLLTPFGLRSLSPQDPNYHSRYEGDQRSRDAAYHQGTVWSWLIGPFITAYVRVHGKSAAIRERASTFLLPFQEHLKDAGLGSVSEIFDGEPPHHPRGCISQAWSVAEILRAYYENISPHPRSE